ncbi:MAG: RDD family protein, partial [Candidatus Limnocylindrales bacterium]
SQLLRKEVELAKVEAREEAHRLTKAATFGAIAGVAALLALVILSMALAWWIDEALNTAVAFAIVGALWIVIVFFVAFLPGEPPDQMPIAGALGIVISLLYWPFWWSRDGQTLAMMPLGLRVVDEKSEATISFGRAVVRFIVLVIGIAIFFLGVLWTLVDGRRRGWHDLAAGTIVVGER